MRFALVFIAGFAASHTWMYWLESWTYTRALASYTCGVFGRENVWSGNYQDGSLCVDMSDAYPASFALDRIISQLSRPRVGPQ
jgi:hypothetical protein